VKFSKSPVIQSSLSHLQLEAVERRSNSAASWRALLRALQYQNPRKIHYTNITPSKMSPSRSFSACMQRALFFLRFFFCLVALHSTPHGALRSAICRGQNTRSYLRYTTQRGGGCVVAQGDVLPICLVGGLQGTEQNGIETPKSRKNLKEEERVCVCQCCCERYWRDGPRRYRYRAGASTSTRLFCAITATAAGCIVVWRRAKKHLYGQSALSESITI
jgi:hypothetical protein